MGDNTDVANLVPGNIPSLGINLVCFLHRISDRVRVYREHGPTFQEDTIMPFLARGNGFARVRGKLFAMEKPNIYVIYVTSMLATTGTLQDSTDT